MPTFVVHTPVGVNQIVDQEGDPRSRGRGHQAGKLRPNSVDSLTGNNSGNNLGPGTPVIHFEQWEHDDIEVKLILKGGGCENKNIQYSLPSELRHLGRADRISKASASASCTPSGRRRARAARPARSASASAATARPATDAKEQLFRTLDDVNPDPRWPSSKPRSWERRTRSASARWASAASVADRLQDRRAEPAARQLLRLRRLRLLGLPPARRRPRREHRARSANGCTAIRRSR